MKFNIDIKTNFSKQISEVGLTNLFLLFVISIITLYPLLFIGFTTNDDANAQIFNLNWDALKNLSAAYGRVGNFWWYPLAWLPYALESRAWFLFIKFGSIILVPIGIYLATLKSLGSRWIALVAVVFFLSFIENGWDHNGLTSYPCSINVFVASFLFSLVFFVNAIERKNLIYACLAGLLYFISLGVELFVLFFPFFAILLLSRPELGHSAFQRILSGKKYFLAIFFPLIFYLLIYLVWRNMHPSAYDGNQLDSLNLLSALKVLWVFSVNAFPIASIKFILSHDLQMKYTNVPGLVSISQLNVAHFIKPLATGLLIFRLMMKSESLLVRKSRTLMIAIAVLFVGIFLPNILLSITKKYQNWQSWGTVSYLYTYYSFITLVIFTATLLAYGKLQSTFWCAWCKRFFIFAVVSSSIVLSFMVEVRNQYIGFDQRLAYRKQELMDIVINSPEFMEIQDGATIEAPSLTSDIRGIAATPSSYWSQYVYHKTGRSIKFSESRCNGEENCYSLIFRQVAHQDSQFVLLTKTLKVGALSNSKTTIYLMPNQTTSMLLGAYVESPTKPKFITNNNSVVNYGSGIFSAFLTHTSSEGLVQKSSLISNVEIIPERITLSHFNIEPQLRSLTAKLAEGINFKSPSYPDFLDHVSGMSDHEPWGRWTDSLTGSAATFTFKEPLPRDFLLEITAHGYGPNCGQKVKVRVGGSESYFIPSALQTTYHLKFENISTTKTLTIVPPLPTSPKDIDSNSGDKRKLGIAIVSIKIHE